MNMPLAGSKLSESARRYLARINSLYDRARTVVAGHPTEDRTAPLQAWEWHRASAEACMEQAARMYQDGLEALLKRSVTVTPAAEADAAPFICRVEPDDGDGALSFRLGPAVMMETAAERQAVEALFGSSARELLEAFAHGVLALQRLGEFEREGSLKLQPEETPAATQAAMNGTQQA